VPGDGEDGRRLVEAHLLQGRAPDDLTSHDEGRRTGDADRVGGHRHVEASREMGEHLPAAGRAACGHDGGTGGSLDVLHRRSPCGAGEGLERVANGVVHRADAVRAELVGEGVAIRHVTDDDGVDAPGPERPGQGERLQ
jgi:hypothetical protein